MVDGGINGVDIPYCPFCRQLLERIWFSEIVSNTILVRFSFLHNILFLFKHVDISPFMVCKITRINYFMENVPKQMVSYCKGGPKNPKGLKLP